METDDWYLKKLLEDVPDDEVHAACFDEEDLHLDAEDMSENENEDEDDVSDQDFVPEADSDHDEISSESTEEWEDELGTEDSGEEGTGGSTTEVDDEDDEEVLGSAEGE